MTPGTHPWHLITSETILAVKLYTTTQHGGPKTYINIPFLATWLKENPDPIRLPNITGCGWKASRSRCYYAIRGLKWERFSTHAFVVPAEIFESEIVGEGVVA